MYKMYGKIIFISGYDLVEWLMDRFNLDEASNGTYFHFPHTLTFYFVL